MNSWRYLTWLLLAGTLAMVLVGGGSFLAFVNRLETAEPEHPAPAQGIVVLTGGADRLADGLRLQESGRGQRLLLSGVNRGTTLAKLKRLLPAHAETLSCCTDLGYLADNTRGNAAESAAWAKSHDFTHLIIVTASYHLPRARAEFEHRLPWAKLVFYPVVPDASSLKTWWQEPALMRILMLEYLKFRLAQLRLLFAPAQEAATKS